MFIIKTIEKLRKIRLDIKQTCNIIFILYYTIKIILVVVENVNVYFILSYKNCITF